MRRLLGMRSLNLMKPKEVLEGLVQQGDKKKLYKSGKFPDFFVIF